MSLDKSLKRSNRLRRRRNVLTRAERIEKLEEEDRWEEGEDSVYGLPKVKVERLEAPSALEEPEEEEEAELLEGEQLPEQGEPSEEPRE